MKGKFKYIGKTEWNDVWCDGQRERFVPGRWYELDLNHSVEAIRTDKFVPDAETFERVKTIYGFTDKDKIEGMLKDKDCFIIGGGTSVNDYDIDSLYDKGFVLAINHSAKYFKSHALIFLDFKFYEQSKEFLQNYKGIIFSAWQSEYWKRANTSAEVYYFSSLHGRLYENDISKYYHEGLYSRANTGLCAINLALIMGAKNIYLYGFDMNYDIKPYKHFYHIDDDIYMNEGNYRNQEKVKGIISNHRTYYSRYNNIYNCSDISLIDCYKYSDYGKKVEVAI